MVAGDRKLNVSFLCTGSSAHSIIAESIMNRESKGRFQAFSAGSHPIGTVHPSTLDLLKTANFVIDNLRSKPWDEFTGPDAPNFDFVFTVCDDAAGELCPVWPGQPMTAHWGVPDPAAANSSTFLTGAIRLRVGTDRVVPRFDPRLSRLRFAAGAAVFGRARRCGFARGRPLLGQPAALARRTVGRARPA